MTSISTADLLDAAKTAYLAALQSGVAEWGDGGITAKHHALQQLGNEVERLERKLAAESGQNFRLATPLRRT